MLVWLSPFQLTDPRHNLFRVHTDAPGATIPEMLNEVHGVLDLLDDLTNYASVDMLAVARRTARPLLAVMVRVIGDTDCLEVLQLEERHTIRCVLRCWCAVAPCAACCVVWRFASACVPCHV